MKRRSFFSSLARAAAIVALAPQLAFRERPLVNYGVYQQLATGRMVKVDQVNLDEIFDMVYAMTRAQKRGEPIDIITDRRTADMIMRVMREQPDDV